MEDNYQSRIKDLIDKLGTWYEDKRKFDQCKMSSKLYPYNNLFSPIQINSIKVKNRIVMAPMGNISMSEETGRPNNKMIQYFIERAKGGVGLITSGLIPISQHIDPSVLENKSLSYFPRIDSSRTVFAGWRDLSEGLHAHGAKFFIQLTPGLGRVGSPECVIKSRKLPVSASWNPNFYISKIPCMRLSDRKCRNIIKNIGQASLDAKAALIDGVYLHGHEGYLLEQMTNPAFNRRLLGEFADWQAFGIKAVEEIRKCCGDGYPIMYRIDLSLALNETYDKKMNEIKSLRKFKKERTVDMTLDYMKSLVKAGVDIFDVDLGCYDNWWLPHPPGPMPPACYLEVAEITKQYFKENKIRANSGLEIPIVAVGKLGYPDICEEALRKESCDMIMLGRPLLADPYWPQKTYAGRIDEIIPCIGDQEGCINEFVEGGHPQCTVNPITGFEDELKKEILSAERKKKVAIVGAGPAGIMCACVAAKRGHEVILYEKSDRIGGLLIPGSAPKIKFDIANYIKYMEKQLEIHNKEYNLSINLNTEATLEKLKEGKFDTIVTCTGTKQVKPRIKGIDSNKVAYAVEVLKNPSLAEKAKNIVVVGGGVVGCETAYFLRHEYNKQVKIIEMLPYFMKGVCTANRGYLIHHLEKLGVELLNCTKLNSVEDEYVIVIKNISKTVPNPYVTWAPILPENIQNPLEKKIKLEEKEIRLQADLVVIAVGGKPNDELFYSLQKENAALELYNTGDSFAQGRVFEATKSAYRIGITI